MAFGNRLSTVSLQSLCCSLRSPDLKQVKIWRSSPTETGPRAHFVAIKQVKIWRSSPTETGPRAQKHRRRGLQTRRLLSRRKQGNRGRAPTVILPLNTPSGEWIFPGIVLMGSEVPRVKRGGAICQSGLISHQICNGYLFGIRRARTTVAGLISHQTYNGYIIPHFRAVVKLKAGFSG